MTNNDMKGVMIYSLQKCIETGRSHMKCDSLNESDRDDILIFFLNKHRVLILWEQLHVSMHKIDTQIYDKTLYLSYKTTLCIAVGTSKKSIQLPSNTHIDPLVYWSTIVKAIENVNKIMRCSISILTPTTLRLKSKWSL